jgi:hypothetical protein
LLVFILRAAPGANRPEICMRRSPLANLSAIFAIALLASSIHAHSVHAQDKAGEVPLPPGGFKPPPAPPVKPYKPVTITLPTALDDASFVAFRKEFAAAVEHKDRAALAKLVVPQGFFWIQDTDVADPKRSGIDNLAKVVDLDAKDGSGWAALAGAANDPTGMPLPEHQNVFCAPAEPGVDAKAFEELINSTDTDPSDWAYPTETTLNVRAAAKPDAPVTEKLGLALVRVLPDSAPPDDPNQPPFMQVATPSGKTGFVAMEDLAGLGGDQICYLKAAAGWKINGYIGGAGQ